MCVYVTYVSVCVGLDVGFLAYWVVDDFTLLRNVVKGWKHLYYFEFALKLEGERMLDCKL